MFNLRDALLGEDWLSSAKAGGRSSVSWVLLGGIAWGLAGQPAAAQVPPPPAAQPPVRAPQPVELSAVPQAPAAPAAVRRWTDPMGRVVVEGEYFAANEGTVVIRKPTGELLGVDLLELSAADQEFVAARRQTELDAKRADPELDLWKPHVWTMRDGTTFRGEVVAFGRREVTFRRNTGVTMVNETPYSRLEPFYQKLVLLIVAEFADPSVKTERDLTLWARSLRGQPKTFTVEGVLLRLEDDRELPIPFFVLSRADMAFLRPGWEQWKSENATYEARQREDFLLQVQADQYQADRAQAQQIQMMKLEMMAAATGLTRFWEVQLLPGPGVWARPLSVVVSARDNVTAQQMAMMQYPGFVAGAVRVLSF